MVLGIASTAMPFARTAEAQAERWLRILREHGEVGAALQALGVSDAPRGGTVGVDPEGEHDGGAGERGTGGENAVERVTECAAQIARGRAAADVSTVDVLIALVQVYGEVFDRVLRAHGVDRETVFALLEVQMREPAAT
jgi:hypothetical protein